MFVSSNKLGVYFRRSLGRSSNRHTIKIFPNVHADIGRGCRAADRRFIKVGKLSVNPYDIGIAEVVPGGRLTLSGGTHSVCRYKKYPAG